MQSPLSYLLVACAALAAARPSDDATVAGFQQLDLAAQTRFLHSWLVDRFEVAAQIAMPERERESQSRRFAKVLERVAGGKSLSAAGLKQLLAEVSTTERSAIDQLSLRYRVQVYSRFRTERREYDRRMSTWRKVLGTWEAAPTHASDASKVIAWLNTALDRMRYDESAVLPPPPRFGESALPQFAGKRPAQPDSGHRLPSPSPGSTSASRQSSSSPDVKPPVAVSRPPVVGSPTANVPDEPRIAHRVEKPALPEVESPPRVIIRDVRPVIAPPESLAFEEEPAEEPPVRVDLNELSIRVRAYNLALNGLTGTLHEEAPWNNRRLAETLGHLTELGERRAQLDLYRELITKDEQHQVGQLLSLDAAIALLGAKIYAARERLADPDSPAASELDGFSRRLAQLAAKRAR